MLRAIADRLLALCGVLLGISLLTFGLSVLAPGDPAYSLLELYNPGSNPSREAVDLMRAQLGLNAPAPLRYLRWLAAVLQGDMGVSYRTGQPIVAEILARLPATLLLTGTSLLLAVAIGLPLGIVSAVRSGSLWDGLGRLVALCGATVPSYVLSLVLILIFAARLRWLPAFGAGSPAHLILPSVALAAGSIAQITRLTRASMLEALQQDYVRTARAKGLRERSVLLGHVLRNALLPVVTTLGLILGSLLSGSVIVETIFSWYGLGKYAVDAIFLRDYPVIQATTLYIALIVVLINAVVDLLYLWINPKLAL